MEQKIIVEKAFEKLSFKFLNSEDELTLLTEEAIKALIKSFDELSKYPVIKVVG